MRKGGIYCKAFLAILLVASFASFAYSVPISPNIMAGYYENSQAIPRYRVSFLNDSWTTELSATTLAIGSDIEWAVLKCDRNQTNCIFGTLDDEGEVQ
ncbi:MAG TPA: hypothetical protein VI875_01495, partial [Candidatus Norongarragalinales archaeon]|nr:hypothetical protein [Candidatus Norongarragalinales archaeon]